MTIVGCLAEAGNSINYFQCFQISLPPILKDAIQQFNRTLSLFPAFSALIIVVRQDEEVEGEEPHGGGRGGGRGSPVWHTGYTVGSGLHQGLRDLVNSGSGQLLQLPALTVR